MTEQKMKTLTKSKLFFIASIVLFVVSMFTQMYITNIFAVKGNEVAKLTTASTSLKREISELTLKKSLLSTLSVLQTQAKSQGFIEMTTAINTLHPVSVASLNSVTY